MQINYLPLASSLPLRVYNDRQLSDACGYQLAGDQERSMASEAGLPGLRHIYAEFRPF